MAIRAAPHVGQHAGQQIGTDARPAARGAGDHLGLKRGQPAGAGDDDRGPERVHVPPHHQAGVGQRVFGGAQGQHDVAVHDHGLGRGQHAGRIDGWAEAGHVWRAGERMILRRPAEPGAPLAHRRHDRGRTDADRADQAHAGHGHAGVAVSHPRAPSATRRGGRLHARGHGGGQLADGHRGQLFGLLVLEHDPEVILDPHRQLGHRE